MSPKHVDHNAKRRLIAEAALKVFSKRGYQTTKIQEIASEAGIGKGTFYEYFQNKEEIVQEIFELKFNQLINSRDIKNLQSPIESLLNHIHETLQLSNKYRDLNRLWFEIWSSQVVSLDHPVNQKMQGLFSNLEALYRNYIEKGQKEKKVNLEINAMTRAQSIVSAMDGIILHSILFKISDSEREERFKDFVQLVKYSFSNNSDRIRNKK